MTFLVLGCSGFIGPPMVRALHAAGHEVVGVSRGRRPADLPPDVVHVVADRGDPSVLAAVVRAHRISTIIDIIAFTEESTALLLDALAGSLDRYVMLSSADVYRNFGGLHRREESDPVLAPMDEDAPLRTSRYMRRGARPDDADPDRWIETYEKITIEAAVREQTAFAWSILRLPMVFGPGDHQRRFSRYIRRLAQGRGRIPLEGTFAGWRSTFGYIDDVVEGIRLAATHPAGAGRIYNLGRADFPSQAEWVRIFGRAMGVENAEAVAVSVEDAPEDQRKFAAGLDFRYPLMIDTGRIRRELGFTEIVDEQTALRRTIEDETAQPEPPGLADVLAEEDMLLKRR